MVAMKKLVLALACAAAGCTTHAAPPGGARRLSVTQLVDIRHPSLPMWSPDGRSSGIAWDRAGVSKVYVADAAAGARAAPPRELPDAGPTLAGAFWSKDGR